MYGSLGLALPFFPIFFSNYGCSSFQVALLTSFQPILLCFLPIVVGHLIRVGYLVSERVLLFCAWGSFLSLVPLYFYDSLVLLFICIFLHAPFRVLLGGLVDASCLSYLGRFGGDYGKLRLYGSLGFILSSFLGSYFFSSFLLIYLLFQFFQVLVISFCEGDCSSGNSFSFEVVWFPFILFLLFGFLHQLSQGVYYVFYSIYLSDHLGISLDWVGLFWVVSVLAEILVMFFYDRLFGSYSEDSVFILSGLLNSLRWFLVFYCSSFWVLFFLQFFHIFSFGTFHLASMRLLDRIFGDSSKAFGVGLFISCSYGLGGFVGVLGSGWLVRFYDLSDLFLYSSFIGLLSLVPIFWRYLKFSR